MVSFLYLNIFRLPLVWSQVKIEVEAHVSETLETRRVEQRRYFVASRKLNIQDTYLTYQKTLPPREWDSLPADCETLEFEPSSVLINAPSYFPLEASDCVEIIA